MSDTSTCISETVMQEWRALLSAFAAGPLPPRVMKQLWSIPVERLLYYYRQYDQKEMQKSQQQCEQNQYSTHASINHTAHNGSHLHNSSSIIDPAAFRQIALDIDSISRVYAKRVDETMSNLSRFHAYLISNQNDSPSLEYPLSSDDSTKTIPLISSSLSFDKDDTLSNEISLKPTHNCSIEQHDHDTPLLSHRYDWHILIENIKESGARIKGTRLLNPNDHVKKNKSIQENAYRLDHLKYQYTNQFFKTGAETSIKHTLLYQLPLYVPFSNSALDYDAPSHLESRPSSFSHNESTPSNVPNNQSYTNIWNEVENVNDFINHDEDSNEKKDQKDQKDQKEEDQQNQQDNERVDILNTLHPNHRMIEQQLNTLIQQTLPHDWANLPLTTTFLWQGWSLDACDHLDLENNNYDSLYDQWMKIRQHPHWMNEPVDPRLSNYIPLSVLDFLMDFDTLLCHPEQQEHDNHDRKSAFYLCGNDVDHDGASNENDNMNYHTSMDDYDDYDAHNDYNTHDDYSAHVDLSRRHITVFVEPNQYDGLNDYNNNLHQRISTMDVKIRTAVTRAYEAMHGDNTMRLKWLQRSLHQTHPTNSPPHIASVNTPVNDDDDSINNNSSMDEMDIKQEAASHAGAPIISSILSSQPIPISLHASSSSLSISSDSIISIDLSTLDVDIPHPTLYDHDGHVPSPTHSKKRPYPLDIEDCDITSISSFNYEQGLYKKSKTTETLNKHVDLQLDQSVEHHSNNPQSIVDRFHFIFNRVHQDMMIQQHENNHDECMTINKDLSSSLTHDQSDGIDHKHQANVDHHHHDHDDGYMVDLVQAISFTDAIANNHDNIDNTQDKPSFSSSTITMSSLPAFSQLQPYQPKPIPNLRQTHPSDLKKTIPSPHATVLNMHTFPGFHIDRRMNVRKIKMDMWQTIMQRAHHARLSLSTTDDHIIAPTSHASDNPSQPMEGVEESICIPLLPWQDIIETLTLQHESHSDAMGTHSKITTNAHHIYVPNYFISLLHLANEKHLELEQKHMDELFIKRSRTNEHIHDSSNQDMHHSSN